MPTIRSLLIALSFVTLIGCGCADPGDEMAEVGGAAGHVDVGGSAGAKGTGGTAGAAGAVGTGGAAAGKGGAAGAVSTGGSLGTGGAASTGGAGGATGGKGGSAPGTGGAAVEPPLCGYVGQYSECTRRSAPGSRLQLGLKGGRTCALCDGRSVTECTLITPDSTDDDVACVTECTECTDWL
jgi:hypothetical protein